MLIIRRQLKYPVIGINDLGYWVERDIVPDGMVFFVDGSSYLARPDCAGRLLEADGTPSNTYKTFGGVHPVFVTKHLPSTAMVKPKELCNRFQKTPKPCEPPLLVPVDEKWRFFCEISQGTHFKSEGVNYTKFNDTLAWIAWRPDADTPISRVVEFNSYTIVLVD